MANFETWDRKTLNRYAAEITQYVIDLEEVNDQLRIQHGDKLTKECLHAWTAEDQIERGCNQCVFTLTCEPKRRF